MSYEFYKLLHLAGLTLVLVSLGTMAFFSYTGGSRKQIPQRKLLAALHGSGLVLLLVAGFGLLARLGLFAEFPLWAGLKLGIWLALGAAPAFFDKAWARKTLWIMIPVLAIFAAALAIWKPV